MAKTKEETFECRDLMIASALLGCGIGLKGTKDSGSFVTFIFESPEKCRELEKEWWQGTLKVTGPRFADAIKHCKSLIYGNRRRH